MSVRGPSPEEGTWWMVGSRVYSTAGARLTSSERELPNEGPARTRVSLERSPDELRRQRFLALEPRELREMARYRPQRPTRDGIHQPAGPRREVGALDAALRQRLSEREHDEPEDQVQGEPEEIDARERIDPGKG